MMPRGDRAKRRTGREWRRTWERRTVEASEQREGQESKEDLVALFFFFDFFQKFLSGLTLDTEFCKGHGFQTPLADFDAALRTDPVCPFVEPGKRFIDGLPSVDCAFP